MNKTKANNLQKSMKPNHSESKLDFLLWILVFLLLSGTIGGTFFYSQDLALPLKISIWILMLLLMTALISQTAKGKMILDFAKKSRMELRKIVWPQRQETIQATGVVILIVIIMSLILWLIDSGLVLLAGFATGQRG